MKLRRVFSGALAALMLMSGAQAFAENDSDAKDKKETVYVTADAYGNPEKAESDIVLRNSGSGDITDYTTLQNIKNTEGDEEFTLNGNNVTWQNHGEDIQYSGTASTDALPLSVKVTYYLEGKEVTADEIAGQAGNVKVQFDYTNNTVGSQNGYVPFLAITMAMLGDDFENVTVENGRVSDLEGQAIVIGYSVPGLSDVMHFSDYKLTEDIDWKESFSFSAYTDNFELAFTATLVSNGIFTDIEEDNLKDLDDLVDDIYDLDYATRTLANGSSDLVNGASEFGEYFGTYVEAVNDAASAGIDTMAISDALSAMADELGEMSEAINELSADGETDTEYLINSYNGLLDSYYSLINVLSSSGAGVDTEAITETGDALLTAYDKLFKGIKTLSDGCYTYYNDGIYEITGRGYELEDLIAYVREIRETDTAYITYSGIADGMTGEVSFIIETAEVSK